MVIPITQILLGTVELPYTPFPHQSHLAVVPDCLGGKEAGDQETGSFALLDADPCPSLRPGQHNHAAWIVGRIGVSVGHTIQVVGAPQLTVPAFATEGLVLRLEPLRLGFEGPLGIGGEVLPSPFTVYPPDLDKKVMREGQATAEAFLSQPRSRGGAAQTSPRDRPGVGGEAPRVTFSNVSTALLTCRHFVLSTETSSIRRLERPGGFRDTLPKKDAVRVMF